MIRNHQAPTTAMPGAATQPTATGRGRGRPQQPPLAQGLLQPLPGWIWVTAFVLTLAGLTTVYPMLTAACVLSLPLCASLLWLRGESPILFACCAFQWLQVAAAVFYCDLYGAELEKVLEAPESETATWYCMGGVCVLALGMRLALSAKGRGAVVEGVLEQDAFKFDLTRVFQFWIFTSFLGTIAEGIGWRVTSLHQFIMPFYNLKWVFFFMLAYLVLMRDKAYGLLLLAMSLEFFFGFFGWFSKYKDGLMMFLIAAMSLRRALNWRIHLVVIVVVVLGFVASVFYASIKIEYRLFSSGNKEGVHGVIHRSIPERLGWLVGKVAHMDEDIFEMGMRSLLSRLQYVSLVGYTISHVPRFEPYSGGELWGGAVKHVLMPRFIFRNKAILDDSERARRFTGLRLSGMEAGTSIGIGYMAESYADFGMPGMFIPVFLLGVLMGRIYQVAIRNRHSAMLGTAIGTAMLFSVLGSFATSNSKILGGLVVLCLAYWCMNKVFGANLIRWLKGER